MKTLRRKDREISHAGAVALLNQAEYGVLSTIDGNGQPYGVPLNFVLKDNRVYFHCALEGHKLDNLTTNPQVSFCVVGKTQVRPERFTTDYESAVAFGTAVEVFDLERRDALLWLLEKYCAEHLAAGKHYITAKDAQTRVFRIDVAHLRGKARR